MLKDRLHFFRRLEHIRDVIVLVADETPQEYLDYLAEREYPFIRCGRNRVDLRSAVRRLADEHALSCIVSDSGGALTGALLEEGIAGEISLIVSPGNRGRPAEKAV